MLHIRSRISLLPILDPMIKFRSVSRFKAYYCISLESGPGISLNQVIYYMGCLFPLTMMDRIAL